MKKIIFIFSLTVVFCSCLKNNKFEVEGVVEGVKENETLYFEHVGVSKVVMLDSVKLKKNGLFKFKKERPEAPDFYRLRIKNQYIDFAIDSTETIHIHANSETFGNDYKVEGSEECNKIRELSLLRNETFAKFKKIDNEFSAKKIDQDAYLNKATEIIEQYKEVAQKSILENPSSTSSYYALLQTINDMVMFNPYDKKDNRIYGAVATQWDYYYPDSERTKHIRNVSLRGMKFLRSNRSVEYKMGKTIDIFDIDLPTVTGSKVKLSEIVEGKITLLDFCSYQIKGAPEYNMQLDKVYEKYKDKGFQIYQVSLDVDEHAWKNAAVNLPWICVRDPKSIYSSTVRMYNVESIPTSFILNREGEIVKRISSYQDLEQSIANSLK